MLGVQCFVVAFSVLGVGHFRVFCQILHLVLSWVVRRLNVLAAWRFNVDDIGSCPQVCNRQMLDYLTEYYPIKPYL